MELTANADTVVESSEKEEEKPHPLMRLREDVQIMPGTRSWNGEPTWTLADPLRNRFFQISDADMRLLRYWEKGTAEAVTSAVSEQEGVTASVEEVVDFQEFLLASELLDAGIKPLRDRIAKASKAREQTLFQHFLHKYLFFRMPLVRPDRFLDWLYPHVRFLFQSWVPKLTIMMGLLGIFLVLQNWERFAGGFPWLMTPSGMIVFGITLIIVKILHELGHALMCKHFGLRVPTMGVAFIVMWPVLYTDASEAWRLTSRRQRALIGAAGVMVELSLAAYAMVAWFLLPDGMLRGVAFTIATTTWIMSAVVNLNPLMRFDGYYFLSDIVNIPNLQDRSFVVAKWRLRQWLFNIDAPAPENYPNRTLFWMVVYAWAILIYRFFLFLGIAVLVYYLFFKALGIFLFMVEITFFIAKPIWNEIKHWRELAPNASLPRKRLYIGLGLVLLFLLVFPWRSNVSLPAILSSQQHMRMYLPVEARLLEIDVKDGAMVKKGDVLMRLTSPSLEHELQLVQNDVSRLEGMLAGFSVDEELFRNRLVLEQELGRVRAQQFALQKELEQLTVKAPFDGQVRDMEPDNVPGRWLGEASHLLTVVASGKAEVLAWVTEQDHDRIQKGASGYFWSEVSHGPLAVPVQVVAVDTSAVKSLDPPFQSATFGGEIVVNEGQNGEMTPRQALYRVRLVVDEDIDLTQRWRGNVVVEGERRSGLLQGATWLMGALIRESGL